MISTGFNLAARGLGTVGALASRFAYAASDNVLQFPVPEPVPERGAAPVVPARV
ncbi:MAG: hypothetical protein L6Q57_03525 [Alphaproteobacteria bacterium]|nr:hypothetical protein [Alphaproteobacteria bacterium]